MSGVRVLVGTRKGAFVLTSDGKREKWDVSGPHFAGWEIYHVKGSPVDPNRLYASQSSGWFGQMIQRSERRRQNVGAGGTTSSCTTASPAPTSGTTARAPLGVQARLASRAIAHRSGYRLRRGGRRRLVPLDRRRADVAGASRTARPRLRPRWQPGAGGMCLHTILLDPSDPKRIFIAISAAGAFPYRRRRQDVEADQPWTEVPIHSRPERRGGPLRSPHRDAPVAPERAVHAEALGRDAQRRRRRFIGKRSAATCRPTSGSRSTFTRTSRTRSTSSPSRATRSTIRPMGSCACTAAGPAETNGRRSRKGLPQSDLLRQRAARRDGRRLARFVRRVFRHHRRAGVRVGRCRRQLGSHRPRSSGRAFRRGPDTAMIRVVLPAHLRTLARVDGEVQLEVEGPVTQRSVLDALEARYPDAARHDPRPRHATAPAVLAVLRLRAGPVPRAAGRPAARGGRLGGRTASSSSERLPAASPKGAPRAGGPMGEKRAVVGVC